MRKIIVFLILSALILVIYAGPVRAKSSEELMQEAELLKSRGYTNAAIGIYSEIIKNDPENSKAFKDFGDLMVEGKNYSYAIMLYKTYLKLQPDDLVIRSLVVDINISLGMDDQAIDECLEYLRIDPANIDVLEKLADIYSSMQMSRDELLVRLKLLEQNPDHMSIKKRIIELYGKNGDYKDAVRFIEKNNLTGELSKSEMAYIYLNGERFRNAYELYKEIYNEDPSDQNRYSMEKAKLMQINYNISRRPGFYSRYYNTARELQRENPNDARTGELAESMRRKLGGVYCNYNYTSGRSDVNRYYRHYGSVYYPVLPTGTDIMVTTQKYQVNNGAQTGLYRQTGIEARQQLAEDISISGAYRVGDPGKTYFGQLYYQGDYVEMAVKTGREYQIETPEALNRSIYYNGTDFYGSWYGIDRLSVFGRYSTNNYSDGNNAKYREIGGYYRVWDNRTDKWLNLGIYNSRETHKFVSPYYYSPLGITRWNGDIEFDWYWTKDSLLRLNYIYSMDTQGPDYNIYQVYADHKFNDSFFIYGEYLNGLSRAGRIGTIEAPGSRDYELNLGLKFKF